jgi:hypothetical protein
VSQIKKTLNIINYIWGALIILVSIVGASGYHAAHKALEMDYDIYGGSHTAAPSVGYALMIVLVGIVIAFLHVLIGLALIQHFKNVAEINQLQKNNYPNPSFEEEQG